MNDLLADLFPDDAKDQSQGERDIEMGIQLQRSQSDLGMGAFVKQDANEDSKSVTKASHVKAIKRRMEKDVDEAGKIAHNVKAEMDALNNDNFANRHKPGREKGTSIERSRTNVTNALMKKFKELMIEFQDLRLKIQDEHREIVERRVITDESTIDLLIGTGDSEQIFQKAIQEMGRRQVIGTLEEIQEQHGTVKEIEKKLLDLHQIYLDAAVLIEAQGDFLDNIENQVSNTVDDVENANAAIDSAKQLQKHSRKWMCVAIIFLLLIAASVVVPIVRHMKGG